jgi:4-amino-4-deoxy-L-arabinose transferase-like glycosyltransferase
MRKSVILLNNTKKSLFLLVVSWILLNIYYLTTLGTVNAYDTPRYLSEAEKVFKSGVIELSYNYWSSGYILTLYFFKLNGLDVAGVIAFQILTSFVAMICCFKAGEKLFNRQAGLTSAALYISYIPICAWNCYLLTESLFISFTLISFYLTLDTDCVKKFLIYLPVFIFSASLRPFGFVILLSIAIYFLSLFSIGKAGKTIRTVLVTSLALLPVILLLINKGSDTYSLIFIDLFKRGDVIADYPYLRPFGKESLVIVDKAPSLFTLFEIIIRNFFYSCQLVILKIIAFIGHAKPYYSLLHNLFIISFLYPVYFFFIKSLKDLNYQKEAKNFILTYFLMTLAIVMISVEDGDGRYLIPTLPLIFVLASKAIFETFNSFFKIFSNTIMNQVKNWR